MQKKLLSILVSSALSTTAFGDITPQSISENKTNSGEPIGFEFNDTNTTVTGNADITVIPADRTQNSRPKGLLIRGDRSAEIQGKTQIDIILASESDYHLTPDSNAAYGIAVGYDHSGYG
ncbi:hypothetical protein [Haemophilus influenzae]|uniref:hypothetical protein n=1 Tax=Haemophilus influenzae TaxID=727 RepID=UPI000D3F09C2|nr:hypothetical protein [Haemophilus influenzae]PRJ09061.1 hypothetical protein BV025_01562 [Haemophilus influenzae]PRM47264.1 hypothetical protein BVZ64_01386 [Haemophilus influenzae]